MTISVSRSYKSFVHSLLVLLRNRYSVSMHTFRVKLYPPILAVVTLQTFYLGKHDLLTVYLGKLDFLSVTDFSPGNLPRENSIFWVLDMSRKQ